MGQFYPYFRKMVKKNTSRKPLAVFIISVSKTNDFCHCGYWFGGRALNIFHWLSESVMMSSIKTLWGALIDKVNEEKN